MRVLLADDNPHLVLLYRAVLEDAGFEVVSASSGIAAIAAAQGQPIDAAVLDVLMPGMSGDEVLHELEQLGTTTPIVLASGYNTQQITQDFTGRGVAAFLQKPYDTSQLQTIARSVIVPTTAR